MVRVHSHWQNLQTFAGSSKFESPWTVCTVKVSMLICTRQVNNLYHKNVFPLRDPILVRQLQASYSSCCSVKQSNSSSCYQ